MVNYAADAAALKSLVPRGTELDDWNGVIQVSMVGFLFLRTRVMGLPVPWHMNFEEVNLRFYVRRRAPDGWRRGVVFVKEIVPRRLIATVARSFYDEPYAAMKMRHQIELSSGKIEYAWRWNDSWNSLSATVAGQATLPAENSEEAFITEHYWGYTARRDGSTSEYRVEHPRWKVCQAVNVLFDCDVAGLYGERFVDVLGAKPQSAFVAEGSAVTVGFGERI